ncbi:MAG: fibronectin type III domain-containing protein [Candidatus Marinimicrobia bacterium]|nr:fibronectin type III domain-containing protein [Candidatus Neomarinimicrobiota bacterium]
MPTSYNYNPRPPRVWSRVQNQCTFVDSSNNAYYESVYIPLTNQTVTLAQANQESRQIQKGNILQYKGNSSQLTKKQKYSQLAKGFGPNRTKVFATQSETYTNPNTTGLLRVNSVEIPFPNLLVGQPNNISGPFQYAVPNPNGCAGFSVQDGGNLVCGTFANPCTGEILKRGATSSVICNPASASNVPGSSTLCWNTKVQTWFPRQRYFMNNSGNKWPQGYKGFVSAVTSAPPILTVDVGCCDVVLNWVIDNSKCIPISSYNIYQNSVFVKTVPYPLTSTTISNLSYNVSYSFYVISVSNDILSLPSNIVTVFIDSFTIILSASAVPTDNTMVVLTWTHDASECVNGWNLYENGVFINSYPVGTTTATISGLIPGNAYTYYIVADNFCDSTSQSNTVTVSPINDTVQQAVSGFYFYQVPSGALYYNNVTVIGGGGGGGGGTVMGTENASGKIGGSGGGGGGIAIVNSQVSITLPAAFTYIVGGGGSGGASASGTSGSASEFTDGFLTNLTGNGGVSGLYNDTLFPSGNTTFNVGGTGGTGSGGNINGTGGVGGNSGGVGSPTNNNTGFSPTSTSGGVSSNINGPGGGGGGGCIYRTSGVGGIYFFSNGASGGNGGAGAIGGTAGQFLTAAGNGSGTIGFGGSGGGGVGGNSFSNSIPTGIAGYGVYGSGGGGGGASHTSNQGYGPGNGNNGGAGFVGFTVYRMIIS